MSINSPNDTKLFVLPYKNWNFFHFTICPLITYKDAALIIISRKILLFNINLYTGTYQNK